MAMAHEHLADGGLVARLDAHIGRFADKQADWHAFPANEGFAELERAQFRYIGAGGSPKVDDPMTLPPGAFTLSLVHQPVGHYAASHRHDVEEAFLVLQGVLTVGWDYDGTIVEARLGPRDMIVNEPDRPHGFRNDGIEPVLMSIMVGNKQPIAVRYEHHPRDSAADVARNLGAAPGAALALTDLPAGAPGVDMARWISRYADRRFEPHPAGFSRANYIGAGGAPAARFSEDVIHVPPGGAVQPYIRDVEDAFFVLGGSLVVGWEEDDETVETRLGARDLVFNPAGQAHWFRNDGVEDAQFMMVVGDSRADTVRFAGA